VSDFVTRGHPRRQLGFDHTFLPCCEASSAERDLVFLGVGTVEPWMGRDDAAAQVAE
jgi:hypothetical protein